VEQEAKSKPISLAPYRRLRNPCTPANTARRSSSPRSPSTSARTGRWNPTHRRHTTSSGDPLAFAEGVKERVIVLDDVKGETVTIDFGAGDPGTKFDEYAPEGQKLVDSIKWAGS
jgi:hypothetical protein